MKEIRSQRIYGTAWNTEKELRLYPKRLEEAKKRDHRNRKRARPFFGFDEIGPVLFSGIQKAHESAI
ncbi:MAG: hypothetical protein CM1200mP16_01300 [Nitrospina sp.]|nr:MAG: hypothetical protein CM1200mP16_01300 [Nitrospina sp.]